MRTFNLLPLLTASIVAYAMPLPGNAQPRGENIRPPQLERLEEGEEAVPAEATPRPPDQQRSVTEKRTRSGRVTEVTVTRGNNTYYLKPNNQVGSALPGDAMSNPMRAPQWQVLEFNAGSPEDTRRQTAEKAARTAPPPPEALPDTRK